MHTMPLATRRLMIALLVGIIAIPTSSTALFLQEEAVEALSNQPNLLREKAMEDRSRLRGQTRLYWQAIRQFQEKRNEGIDVTKPDVNDPSSFERIFSAAPPAAADDATSDGVDPLPTDQLTAETRALLRRYTRARTCPESLKNFSVPGFYELCLSIVGLSASSDSVTGLMNHNAYVRGQLRPTAPKLKGFKLRLQMMKEALDPTTKREGGAVPSRPTHCGNNPNCLVPRGS